MDTLHKGDNDDDDDDDNNNNRRTSTSITFSLLQVQKLFKVTTSA